MKYRLATPGPMMVPPEALLELAKPVRHHRTPENKALVAEAMSALKQVFLTQNDVLILTSSGTGAMEMAFGNLVKAGDEVIICSCGKWGERWQEIAKAFGAKAIVLEEPYGKSVSPARVEQALCDHPQAAAVLATLCETSTAVGMDIKAIGEIVAKSSACLIVDGISGVGAMECRVDDWHIDMLVVGSQKALMLPPGLAFLSVSAKVKSRLEQVPNPPTYYFNLKRALKSAAESDTPFTPAHTLIASLVTALRMMLAEGMENIWSRTALLAKAMQSGIAKLGLKSLADPPCTALTAIVVPDGIDCKKWEKLLESKYGVKVAGGQGSLTGKIIRIAHMGIWTRSMCSACSRLSNGRSKNSGTKLNSVPVSPRQHVFWAME